MAYNPVSPEVAVNDIKSGERVYLHGMAAAPTTLVHAMVKRSAELRHVEVVQMHTEGPAPYVAPEMAESFRVNALFVSGNIRQAVNELRADFTPIFFSDIPHLFRSGAMPIDTALIHVSPPDRHGFCSLGVSVETTKAAVDVAKRVIAQVNPNMPRTHGDGLIHIDAIHQIVEVNDPLPEAPPPASTEVEDRIGAHVAELIEDGATIQMGIGAIPNAVLACLHGHKDLGVHSEMFSDGVVELVEKGVINGRQKKVHPGKLVSGFVMGTRKLYDFVDDNPLVAMLDIAYVNDTHVIRRNPKMTAINSAIEVDLTGQVCADSIGSRLYSGVGGQMDFLRGAALSVGGKPIIALPSTTSKGISRIVPMLKPGAGVVTTRAHVHWIVTEYGAVNVHGMNLRHRAKALIELAHPDHRESLEREAFALQHS